MNNFTYADLKGISKMKLSIEYLSPKAESCGITREEIETSARYILSNSKISIVDKGPFPYLYIQANISNNDGCYANSNISVYRNMQDPISKNWGEFVYYTKSEIYSGGTGTKFGDPFINALEQLLKSLVVIHSKDNQ